jgi:fibronectin type 3 domain-containing protein
VALDFHFNASEYAATTEVILPDTIAPEKPLLTNYSADEKGIHLQWAKSGSTDAVKTLLLRRTGNEPWKTLADVTGFKSNSFSDTSARRGIRYEYALETVDDAGLSSGKTRPMSIVGSDNGLRPGVNSLKGQYDKVQKLFSLTWEYKPQGRYNFVIYRGAPGQDPENIGQVSGSERSFSDNSMAAQKEGYDYSVKVIWADGGESELSTPFEVRFTKGK